MRRPGSVSASDAGGQRIHNTVHIFDRHVPVNGQTDGRIKSGNGLGAVVTLGPPFRISGEQGQGREVDIGCNVLSREGLDEGIPIGNEPLFQLNDVEVIGSLTHGATALGKFDQAQGVQPFIVSIGELGPVSEVSRVPFQCHPSHGGLDIGHVAFETRMGDVIPPIAFALAVEFRRRILGLAMQAM